MTKAEENAIEISKNDAGKIVGGRACRDIDRAWSASRRGGSYIAIRGQSETNTTAIAECSGNLAPGCVQRIDVIGIPVLRLNLECRIARRSGREAMTYGKTH